MQIILLFYSFLAISNGLWGNREFSNERVRVERREKYRKEKMRREFTQGFTAYFDWVSHAGEYCWWCHQKWNDCSLYSRFNLYLI